MIRPLLASALAVPILLLHMPQPARAQEWIGRAIAYATDPRNCLGRGATIDEAETAEARGPAVAWMRGYWARVSALPAGAAPATLRKDGQVLRGSDTRTGTADPWVRDPALAAAAEPEIFVRSGADASVDAHGIWRVVRKDDPAQVAGYYHVKFDRNFGRWGFGKAWLYGPAAKLPEVRPYCNRLGDLEIFQAEQAVRAARKAAKAEAKRPTGN